MFSDSLMLNRSIGLPFSLKETFAASDIGKLHVPRICLYLKLSAIACRNEDLNHEILTALRPGKPFAFIYHYVNAVPDVINPYFKEPFNVRDRV